MTEWNSSGPRTTELNATRNGRNQTKGVIARSPGAGNDRLEKEILNSVAVQIKSSYLELLTVAGKTYGS
jgi:hypothetical protein